MGTSMKLKIILVLSAMAIMPVSAGAAVLANIGEHAITEDMIHEEYDSISSEQRKAINADEMTRRNIVDSAINSEVLVLSAKKAGLDKDEEYTKALEHFQKQYLSTKFMQKAIEPKLAKPSIKKFFEENRNFFDSTQVCASHIVMQDMDEAAKVGKLAKEKGAKQVKLPDGRLMYDDLDIGGIRGGDLYLDLHRGYYFSGDWTPAAATSAYGPGQGGHVFDPRRPEMHAALTLAGPGVKRGVAIGPVRNIDMAPTITHLLGMPLPARATGRVLEEALTE